VDIPTLSVDEAIHQRQRLHQKKVRVRGVLTLKREHSGLRSLDQPPKVSDKDGRHEIWIHFPTLKKTDWRTFGKEYHQAAVEIYGTFNADGHGHMSLFAAEMNTIEITKLPATPTELRGSPQ